MTEPGPIEPFIREAEKIQGWMAPEELGWLARTARNSKIVIEIGTWKGRSTFALCATPGKVYSVDHFKGNSNPNDATAQEVASRGPDAIFSDFMNNVGSWIAREKLMLFRMKGSEAANMLTERIGKESADFIFIDADHEYAHVKEDIENYLPLLKPGGIISGHDFNNLYPGVVRAVYDLLPTYSMPIGSIWMHQRQKEGA